MTLIDKLMALAAPGSGATTAERRNAAAKAASLIATGALPTRKGPPRHAPDAGFWVSA